MEYPAKADAELRVIGSIRRECLDHMIVLGEAHLQRTLDAYTSYYNSVRAHLALDKNAPLYKPISAYGRIRAQPILSGHIINMCG